jgi:hypothetical protein
MPRSKGLTLYSMCFVAARAARARRRPTGERRGPCLRDRVRIRRASDPAPGDCACRRWRPRQVGWAAHCTPGTSCSALLVSDRCPGTTAGSGHSKKRCSTTAHFVRDTVHPGTLGRRVGWIVECHRPSVSKDRRLTAVQLSKPLDQDSLPGACVLADLLSVNG